MRQKGPCLIIKYLYGTVFLQSQDGVNFFSFQNNPKNLDPSEKKDLDLWDCLGG